MTALPLLGGNNGLAGKINNRGQIAGVSETPNSDPCSPFALQIEAVMWENGQVQELSPLHGDADGFANAINDNGEVVGQTGSCSGIHAVLWRHGTPINLGNLGGVTNNFAFDINNRGSVVGQSDLPGDTLHHAFLWQNGVMTDLGSLPGLPTSLAGAINNRGQVVGFSNGPSGDPSAVAWLWQNSQMIDLNTVISPGSPLFLMEANGINDRGEIVGFGRLENGDVRAYILIPCDDDHRDVEGCDYDMVDGSDIPATQMATTAKPVLSPDSIRQLMQSAGRRSKPWYRASEHKRNRND
jgi:probable HAF family extracellular repeat protein